MREGSWDRRVRVSSEYDEMASDYERVRPHALARPIKFDVSSKPPIRTAP